MADRELRLRVGAAIDASFGQVMSSVVEAAKRARRQIAAELVAGAKEGSKAQKVAAHESVVAIQSTTGAAKSAKQQADAMAADVLRKAKSNAREKVSIEKAAMREVEADLRAHNAKRIQMAKDAANEESKSGSSPRGLSRGGALMVRAGAAALGAGARLAGSALHGMGVDTSLQSQLSAANARQTLAVDVASQGYIGSGKGPKGSNKYTDPNEIMEAARSVGNATGTDTKDVLEGMNKFVKMTGDLQTARDSMAEIGKIAKANGADMGDMMEAAANVSIAMGEVPEKGKHLGALMRTIAGEGHLGAVAIKDMAAQMGKLTAQANFFKLDPMSAKTLEKAGVTDETGQRVAVMGAMAQWARAKGGRITAQQATQSSMAFIRDLANPTEVKRMAGQGINVYSDPGHTKVRDPLQMFLEVAKKAQVVGGLNRDVINKVFPNQQSRAVGNAMMMDYNAKYKEAQEKGITDETKRHQFAMEGLTDTFQNYLRVTQSSEEVQMKFNAAMNTAESQTKILNNRLGETAEQLSKALLPAIVSLTPAIVGLANWITNKLGDILGTNKSKEIDASVKSGLAGVNAMSMAEHVVNDATKPGRQVRNFLTGEMMEEVNKGSITKKDDEDIRTAKTALEAAVEAKRKVVGEEGKEQISSGDAHYNELNPKELSDLAGRGDIGAQKFEQDTKNYEQMKDTLNRLSNAIDKIDVLKNAGRIQEVAIVEDHTVTPKGAEPKTSGTSSEDSSH